MHVLFSSYLVVTATYTMSLTERYSCLELEDDAEEQPTQVKRRKFDQQVPRRGPAVLRPFADQRHSEMNINPFVFDAGMDSAPDDIFEYLGSHGCQVLENFLNSQEMNFLDFRKLMQEMICSEGIKEARSFLVASGVPGAWAAKLAQHFQVAASPTPEKYV